MNPEQPLLNMKILLYQPEPGCSKLTTSLVNVSLKFQRLISNVRQYFLLKKSEKMQKLLSLFNKNVRSFCSAENFSHFFNKNISVFRYKVVKHLTR